MYVREQLKGQLRNHASGGSWRARHKKYRITLAWQTMISNSCFSSTLPLSSACDEDEDDDEDKDDEDDDEEVESSVSNPPGGVHVSR